MSGSSGNELANSNNKAPAKKPTLTVALGGGGVAALGHIPVLAALDEMGLKPTAIAGSSMGAVIAACYGAGMTAAEIEEHARTIFSSPIAYARRYLTSGWQGLLTGTIEPEFFIDTVAPDTLPTTLGGMCIPTTVVATDIHQRESVLFKEEDLRKSLAASIAIPGVFRPLSWHGRVLVDGGVSNNLPVDVLPDSDFTLAVDVSSEPLTGGSEVPGALNAVTSSIRIMLWAITQSKLRQRDNVIFVQPESRVLGPLDLSRIVDAIDMSKPQTELVKRHLNSVFE